VVRPWSKIEASGTANLHLLHWVVSSACANGVNAGLANGTAWSVGVWLS